VWATRIDHKRRRHAYLALGFTRLTIGKSTKKEKRDKGKAIRGIQNEWINAESGEGLKTRRYFKKADNEGKIKIEKRGTKVKGEERNNEGLHETK
jgi:hypothetical protein